MLREETKARLRRFIARKRSDLVTGTERQHGPHTPTSNLLQGGTEVQTPEGNHWLIRRSLSELWPSSSGFIEGWSDRREALIGREQNDDYREFLRSFPNKSAFLDLETCGFAGTAVFLAGLLHVIDGQIMISQFWARDLAEERAMMHSLRAAINDQHVLVTFNGKSFDWPQVRDRCILHTGDVSGGLSQPTHLDLLHPSRRKWKAELPNCKLQTIERFVFGRMRHGDIPGSQIPAVYANYVKSGVDRDANRILHHNALDLITLLQLALCIRD